MAEIGLGVGGVWNGAKFLFERDFSGDARRRKSAEWGVIGGQRRWSGEQRQRCEKNGDKSR
jgi:hypothetical protein